MAPDLTAAGILTLPLGAMGSPKGGGFSGRLFSIDPSGDSLCRSFLPAPGRVSGPRHQERIP